MAINDSVYIEALEVASLIGAYEFERKSVQALYLDLELTYDCEKAGDTDDLHYALDYDRLSKTIREWSLEQKFELLEAYGESLCRLIHEQFGIHVIKLKINKPAAVEGCAAIGIKIERQYYQ